MDSLTPEMSPSLTNELEVKETISTPQKAHVKKKRFPGVDQIRGFSVFLMIIFHFSFDLNYFQFASIDFIENKFWYLFPRVIVFLFLFSVGISLCLSHRPTIKWKAFWKRFLQISFFAALISGSTYYFFPTRWIYFGTLHCIALSSLWGLLFLNHPKVSLTIALALLIPSMIWDKTLPWPILPHLSMDYISPFPWFGCLLIGIFYYHQNWHHLELGPRAPKLIKNSLEFMGKHSLVIYLIHQPILFGLVYLFYRLLQ